jgi:CheY-like chemotaxis protein
MAEIIESEVIIGVKFVELKVWADDRGRFLETFRKEWFPERSWEIIQANCSYSRANVLRGLHYHLRQVDYWFATQGMIRVATGNRYLVPENDGEQGLPEGQYVVLSVEDNGDGISEADLEHIFEPFYTRKMMGRSGTGLGLTVVWNTVQDHGGRVKVKRRGDGSVFELFFPLVAGEVRRAVEDGDATINLWGNQEHVLVVDDEPHLRDIAAQILEGLNYKVDLAENGEQAVEFVKKQPVDLVLIDMLMEPGMNGRQAYEKIVKLHPGQKAIIVSGYSESYDVKVALNLGAKGFLKKPYSIEQLGMAVKESLAGG